MVVVLLLFHRGDQVLDFVEDAYLKRVSRNMTIPYFDECTLPSVVITTL